eukprot:TRINITY_DN21013_c0_g1_i1.p1 TRINITY_DN21013_c0_g1~~TRINITY_DN21013_c0_g1_i1.p1  ORF type:complete len:231 (-),score=37.35 TRINITY_DN21013_c0_g1_i1:169-861(-)
MASAMLLSHAVPACTSSPLSFVAQPKKCRSLYPTTCKAISLDKTGTLSNSFKGQSLRFVPSLCKVSSSSLKSSSSGPVSQLVERTYVMIKPDGVQRGLVGEIILRFERKGFALKGLKLFQCPRDLAQEHYKDLKEKPFFPKLVDYIVSGPVVCMVWEGAGSVASGRKLIGATNPLAAEPGTIRGDLAVEVGRNVIHGSDSPENAEREIDLWFKEVELCQWKPEMTPWIRE